MFCEKCGTVLDIKGNCINCEKRQRTSATPEIINPLKAKIGSLD
ncbi:MAG: hypothetical protein ACXADW_02045 [Candidatus Hodarchaeales archaeon]|jgi:hypothetical protein